MEDLQSTISNALFLAEDDLRSIAAGDERERSGFAYVHLAYQYRSIAVCRMRLLADRREFQRNLCLSGQAFLHLQRLAETRAGIARAHVCASRAFGLSDALAAGDLATASEIAGRLPARHDPELEYEDDFLAVRALALLAVASVKGQPADLTPVLARWEEVLDGGEDPALDVTRALVARDAGALESSLDALSQRRWDEFERLRKTPGYDPVTLTVERYIHLRGFAYLRIAELRGTDVPREVRLMPGIARVPAGAPLPAPDAWRAPPT